MVLRALVFCLITFGIAMVIAFMMALVIKIIARIVQGKKKAPAGSESK